MDNMREGQVFDGMNEGIEPEKTRKGKRSKKNKNGKKDHRLTLAMVAILTAFVVFVVLVVIQDRIVNEGVTKNVVVAIKDIPAGTKLTQENMSNYLTVEARPEEQIPENGTFSNGYNLIDRVADRDIQAKEMITEECLYEADFFTEVSDPVEISIAVGDLGRAVAGTLRAGDLVDIKTVIRVKMDEDETDTDGSVTNVGEVPSVTLEDPEAETQDTVIASEEAIILDILGNILVDPNINLTYGVTGEYAVQTIAENVRVVAVYTSGGENTESVEASGSTMIATVINVVVPRTLQDRIYLAMAEGNIQLARVENDPRIEIGEAEMDTESGSTNQ